MHKEKVAKINKLALELAKIKVHATAKAGEITPDIRKANEGAVMERGREAARVKKEAAVLIRIARASCSPFSPARSAITRVSNWLGIAPSITTASR
jgi:hypothetical protein